MPDWSYRTVLQPLLFQLPLETARGIALGSMGRLSRLPFGSIVIDLFGHMHPDPRLRTRVGGIPLAAPVGIGHVVDPHGLATAAISRFGVGFVEVGPIAVKALAASRPAEFCHKTRSIRVAEEPGARSVDDWIQGLATRPRPAARILARLTFANGTISEQATRELCELTSRLASHVDGFILTSADEACRAKWSVEVWREHLERFISSNQRFNRPVWLAISADLAAEPLLALVGPALEVGCRGIVIEGRLHDPAGGWIFGPAALPDVVQTIKTLRSRFGSEPAFIAGGIHEPIEALQLKQSGANAALIDTGLIYSGPGLPKRINEAVLFADSVPLANGATPQIPETEPDDLPSVPTPIQKSTWFWTLVLGLAMLIGGLLAFGIASTRIILPYDEVFVGMTRDELNLINPRLLAFMQHDRVTLSGTMIAVAVLYLFLSWFGIRRGAHWSVVAILLSALVGFTSFFLFLGFGYFDPFHAFITAIMLQFSLLAWQGNVGEPQFTTLPNLRETPAWRRAQWGQLLFVIHGAVLVSAGLIISGVGCTSVFVREDLEFMDVCPSDLTLANPRLIPLIAHDRASFGGMLIATGISVLLTAMWGFREGARWQWWMLLLAGVPAYAAAIGIHLVVGYTSWWHLAPAYGGLLILLLALALLWSYLGQKNRELIVDWDRLRGTA